MTPRSVKNEPLTAKGAKLSPRRWLQGLSPQALKHLRAVWDDRVRAKIIARNFGLTESQVFYAAKTLGWPSRRGPCRGEMMVLKVRMKPEMYQRVGRAARTRETTMQGLVHHLIQEYLDNGISASRPSVIERIRIPE